MSKAAEVSFGESQEKRILARWMLAKGIKAAEVRAIASRAFQDWDFLLLDKQGYPLCYVEIKHRRTSFGKYGDAIAPIRKHAAALVLRERNISFVLVTEYPDALVQLDLAQAPASRKVITRRDRPGQGVPHGLWAGAQLEVIEGGDD